MLRMPLKVQPSSRMLDTVEGGWRWGVLAWMAVSACTAARPLTNASAVPPTARPASEPDIAEDCYRGHGDWSVAGRLALARSDSAASTAPATASLARKSVLAALARENLGFWACIQPPNVPATAQGHVGTRFSIDAEGRVSESHVISSQGASAAIEDCVGRALCRMVFPKPVGAGQVEIRQAFTFGHGAIAAACYVGHNDLVPTRPSVEPAAPPPDAGATAAAAHVDRLAKGWLYKEDIRAVIRRQTGSVRSCYERALVARPALQGRVDVRFVIDTNGAVAQSAIHSTTLGDAQVEDCIGQAACDWQFPRPNGGGIVIVSYPFNLIPGD
jgi:outer membrane biosynthesis protein TonB